MAGAPRKPFQPYCRVCEVPLRRQGVPARDAPGTKIAAVNGLCPKHYTAIRTGKMEDPGKPVVRAAPDEWAWRSELDPLELQLLAALERRYPVGSLELEELGTALGLRTRGGVRPTEYIGSLRL